jgi:hypothetical protein
LLNKTPSTLVKVGFEESITTSAKLRQPKNASDPMLATPTPIVMLVRLVQLAKARLPKLVTLSGTAARPKLVQSSKAEFPMLITLLPIVMLVSATQY